VRFRRLSWGRAGRSYGGLGQRSNGRRSGPRVDVVLCDVLLDASRNGRTIKEAFARHLGLGHVPFAFMTASPREARNLTDEYVLRKPFGTWEVVGFLNRVPRQPINAERAGSGWVVSVGPTEAAACGSAGAPSEVNRSAERAVEVSEDLSGALGAAGPRRPS
jgi:hypothetical protein